MASPMKVWWEQASLVGARVVGEEARTVRQAARELRRKGATGELHFRVSGGQARQMSAASVARARELEELRHQRALVDAQAKEHDELASLRRQKAALGRYRA